MGFRDTLKFDRHKYYKKHRYLDPHVLRKKHHAKVMLLASTTGGVAAGVGGAVVTGGLSIAGAAYSGRQHYIARKQMEILEEIMEEEGIEIPRTRKRDVAGGAAIAAASLGLAVGAHEVRLSSNCLTVLKSHMTRNSSFLLVQMK
jgi:hypothetical protein